jgi:hypothetical protein
MKMKDIKLYDKICQPVEMFENVWSPRYEDFVKVLKMVYHYYYVVGFIKDKNLTILAHEFENNKFSNTFIVPKCFLDCCCESYSDFNVPNEKDITIEVLKERDFEYISL